MGEDVQSVWSRISRTSLTYEIGLVSIISNLSTTLIIYHGNTTSLIRYVLGLIFFRDNGKKTLNYDLSTSFTYYAGKITPRHDLDKIIEP